MGHTESKLVGRDEACRLFGVSRTVWRRWQGRGWVGGRRIGKRWLFDAAQLHRLLEECGRLAPPYPDPDRPGVYRVPLTGRDMHRREAIIDAEDLPLVQGSRWTWSDGRPGQSGQVVRSYSNDTTRLRQVIMGVSGPASRVGHRNGDGLDCRRENLFVRTKLEQNRGARKFKTKNGKPCSSRFKGVCWDKQTEKWRVGIVVNGKNRCLGRFSDEIAGAEAYDEAAREFFGEHARLNFPDGVDAALARAA